MSDSKMVMFRATRSERDALNRFAQERGVSVAQLIRGSLERDGAPIVEQRSTRRSKNA